MATEERPEQGNTIRREYRFTVLIADDDRGIRETLAEVLDKQGFRTVLASDGDEAVELVQVDLVHLILFDMNMPRLTGLEALAVIRQTLDKILPAVLMTADATNDLIRRAFQAQVFSVIPKPVNTNIVLNTLTRALSKVYGNAAGTKERGTVAPPVTMPDIPPSPPQPPLPRGEGE
jgi:CheY-like chemotaxis protein